MAADNTHEDALTAVLIPIRSFRGALSRLTAILGAQRCSSLMQLMAQRVVLAAEPMPVHVVTDDAEVADWAARQGAEVVAVGRPGLNVAVTCAVDHAASAGFAQAVIAHADLALADTLRPAVGPGLTIVGDRRRDGSNVMCVPTGSGFRFSYGPGSFGRHVLEAQRLGIGVNIMHDDSLAVDIDFPEDLSLLPADLRSALGLEPLVATR